MGGIGRVVSYRGFMAIGDLGHILGERDGEKLQALNLALGGINGNLLIKRVGSTANGEPQRQWQQALAVDREGALGQIQIILS